MGFFYSYICALFLFSIFPLFRVSGQGVHHYSYFRLWEQRVTEDIYIQYIGVPAVLEGRSVVLGSHTGSGKTLAYMLPLVQQLRGDEALSGVLMKPRRPRDVVLCSIGKERILERKARSRGKRLESTKRKQRKVGEVMRFTTLRSCLVVINVPWSGFLEIENLLHLDGYCGAF